MQLSRRSNCPDFFAGNVCLEQKNKYMYVFLKYAILTKSNLLNKLYVAPVAYTVYILVSVSI